MNINKKIINSTVIIFITVALFYAVGNFIWWQTHTPIVPIGYAALHFNDIFKTEIVFYNAPLLTYLMKFMFFMFGKEYYDLIVIFINYIFFLIPLYFIYKIGLELKDVETGNVAMILFALVPAVYGLSRQYGHQDYHIIAAITANIYCLIKSDYFRNRKWSIWYGISAGLGLMIKDAFLAYFFIPFVYVIIIVIRNNYGKKEIKNILIAVGGIFIISACHYFRLSIIRKVLYEPVVETAPVFSFESLKNTTTGLCEHLLSFPIFLVFIIGLLYFIWKYKGQYKNVILLWFFVPWTIITFMPHHKIPEYCVGFIPAMILVGSIFLVSVLKNRIRKIFVMILFIIIGILQYIDFSYNKLNFKLFNFELNWKGYNISYYRKDSYLMTLAYNVQKPIIKVIEYLKLKYPNKKSKIYIMDHIDIDGLLAYANIKNVDCTWPDRMGYGNIDVLKSDIIIFFNCQKTIEQLIQSQIKKMEEYPWGKQKNKDTFIKEETQSVEFIYNTIEKEYQVIDSFYFDESNDAKSKVLLFGRKNHSQP